MRFIPGHREHLHARVGDRLVIESEDDDRPTRHAVILEVHGQEGAPPYIVRWDDGQVGAVFPGPGARVEAAGS